MTQPEQAARQRIDALLEAAGWRVCSASQANIHGARGVAIREFPLKSGHGFADYLLYVDGKAAGVIEAKKEGVTLSGVERQAEKYTLGLPDGLPRWASPLPFAYQSTGVDKSAGQPIWLHEVHPKGVRTWRCERQTRFTNGLDPEPRSRALFAFHRPNQLAAWLEDRAATTSGVKETPGDYRTRGRTFLDRLQHMPLLAEQGLWPAQVTAIKNLEKSLTANKSRALIQMATGAGKTFTAISFIYRLIKFAGARRVLFLVDRGNLGDQTLKEFQQYASPYNNFKFTEEYIVQRLTSNTLDTTARVCICTIQRMYSMLKGKELPEDLEEESVDQLGGLFKQPEPIEYNPAIPIESFDIIVTDECHRSIYNLWAQVLEYFDAYLIGLTATPSKQTFGFFRHKSAGLLIWSHVVRPKGGGAWMRRRQNLVMEYNHEMAVADGVNVNYDVYRIRTKITEAGSKVEAGYSVQIQERDNSSGQTNWAHAVRPKGAGTWMCQHHTRKKRWEQLDDDFSYDPNQLDRDVVAPDQIRKIVQTYRDKLFTEIFPGREWVPKTLIFAKDDAHAENIVEIVREDKSAGQPIWSHEVRPKGDGTRMCRRQFGKGNDFAQKITYRTTGAKPKDLINEFRTSPMPRIAVTVDMIATGTDIKAVEVVMFLRAVKSRAFFEQMKGRGVRVIKPDDLQSVTPDAKAKDHFVIVDAVGVCEQDKTDSRPMEQKPTVSFEKLLQAVAFGNTEDDVLTSLAGRLARMAHSLKPEDDQRIRALAGGLGVKELSHRIVAALNPDRHIEQAKADLGLAPDDDQLIPEAALQAARQKLILDAIKPLHDPELRQAIDEIKKKNEVVIDHVSADEVLEAHFSEDALDRARGLVQSFEQFIEAHKDEITALQVLYSKPYKQRLTYEAVKELAAAIEKPPYLWNESQLWQAYAALEKSKVKGASGRRILTDLVSLVRYAMHQDNELVPFPERVNANFKAWLAQQQKAPSPSQGEGWGGGKAPDNQPRFTEEQLHWLEMIRDHIAANLGIEPDDFELPPFTQEGGLGKVHQLFGEKLNAIIEELNETLAA